MFVCFLCKINCNLLLFFTRLAQIQTDTHRKIWIRCTKRSGGWGTRTIANSSSSDRCESIRTDTEINNKSIISTQSQHNAIVGLENRQFSSFLLLSVLIHCWNHWRNAYGTVATAYPIRNFIQWIVDTVKQKRASAALGTSVITVDFVIGAWQTSEILLQSELAEGRWRTRSTSIVRIRKWWFCSGSTFIICTCGSRRVLACLPTANSQFKSLLNAGDRDCWSSKCQCIVQYFFITEFFSFHRSSTWQSHRFQCGELFRQNNYSFVFVFVFQLKIYCQA